jgi:hypothetical protein
MSVLEPASREKGEGKENGLPASLGFSNAKMPYFGISYPEYHHNINRKGENDVEYVRKSKLFLGKVIGPLRG